jgi:hypothetical protein
MLKYFNNETITQEDLAIVGFKHNKNKLKILDLIEEKTTEAELQLGMIFSNEILMENYHSDLLEFKKISDENNITIRPFLFPLKSNNTNYSDNLIIELQKVNIEYFDFLNLFEKIDKEKFYWTDDTHPSPFGHRIIASLLYNQLIVDKVLPNWEELEPINITKLNQDETNYYARKDFKNRARECA